MKTFTKFAFSLTLALGLASLVNVNAQNTFIQTATPASWGVAANWDTNTVPSGIDVSVLFNTPIVNQTVTLDGARTVGSMSITNNSAFTFLLSNGAGGSLIFDTSGANATLTVGGTGTAVSTISATTTLNKTLDVTVNNTAPTSTSGAVTLTGGISGVGGLIKNGAGTLSSTTAAKTYTGATVVNQGILRFSATGAANATSSITVNSGGQLRLDSSAGVFSFGAAVITLNGAGTGTSFGALLNAGSGANTLANNIVLASDATISSTSTGVGAALILNGSISGPGGLTKAGAGTVTVNQASTYGGATTISAGTLQLGGTAGSLPTASVITNNGTFTINRSNAVVQGTDFNGAGISGTGSFVQAGAGTTTLNMTNTYSGGTTISGGTLIATKDGALGSGNVSLTASGVTLTLQNGATNNYISDIASISIVTGATLNLNFSGNADTVGNFVINGVAQAAGTYNATTTPGLITGTGSIFNQAVAIPEPATYMLFGLGVLVCAQQFRRRRKA